MSAYHTQINCLVERLNGTIEIHVAEIRIGRIQAVAWPWGLLLLLFAVQDIPQAPTEFSPFQLLYGQQPQGISDLLHDTGGRLQGPHLVL